MRNYLTDRKGVVMVDGLNSKRNVIIRDPLEGTIYQMTIDDFKKAYIGHAAYRIKL
jgi:hypothetical protein